MVHKILHEQCPGIVKHKFTKRSQVSKDETRRMKDLHIPRTRLEITRKGFYYKGAKVWNDIPNNVGREESATTTIARTRSLLCSGTIYRS